MRRFLLVLVVVALIPTANAEARTCSDYSVGTAYFDRITVTGASCKTAKRLLDRTTLNSNRKGRSNWSYGGWAWTLTRIEETSRRIRGKRGSARVSSIWSTT